MNERIRELAEQAGAIIFSEQTRSGDWVDFSDYTGFDHTKFAELIVRECIDVVVDVLPDIVPESKGGIHPAWHLKEYFGVEE